MSLLQKTVMSLIFCYFHLMTSLTPSTSSKTLRKKFTGEEVSLMTIYHKWNANNSSSNLEISFNSSGHAPCSNETSKFILTIVA